VKRVMWLRDRKKENSYWVRPFRDAAIKGRLPGGK
jgi:hypothetical protein